MRTTTGFRLTQGVYYLGLGIWAGAMVMLVIGAMQTFATVRSHAATLSMPSEGPPEMLAGEIVGRMLAGLTVLQAVCAVLVVAALVMQHTLFTWALRSGRRSWANLTRVILIALPVAVLFLNVLLVGPAVLEHRGVMYDAQQPTERREAARERFEQYHQLSERTHGAALFMLVGAVLVSPFAFELPRGEGREGARVKRKA